MVGQDAIRDMRFILSLPLPTEARMLMEHIDRLSARGPVERQAPPVQVDNFNAMMSGGDGWMDANRYFAGPAPGQARPGLLTDERHGGGRGADDIDPETFERMTGLLLEG